MSGEAHIVLCLTARFPTAPAKRSTLLFSWVYSVLPYRVVHRADSCLLPSLKDSTNYLKYHFHIHYQPISSSSS